MVPPGDSNHNQILKKGRRKERQERGTKKDKERNDQKWKVVFSIFARVTLRTKSSRWYLMIYFFFYLFPGSDVVRWHGWWEYFCDVPWDKWSAVKTARLKSLLHNLFRSQYSGFYTIMSFSVSFKGILISGNRVGALPRFRWDQYQFLHRAFTGELGQPRHI